MKILPQMYSSVSYCRFIFAEEELIKFWKSSASKSRSGIYKDSIPLPEMAVSCISLCIYQS